MKERKPVVRPSLEEIQKELAYRHYQKRVHTAIRHALELIVVVAAVVVVLSTFIVSVLKVQGMSMEPTFEEGQIIVAFHTGKIENEDIITFYYNNKVLLKRVIGMPGDWINIDKEGNVTRNDIPVKEAYIRDKSQGSYNIKMPYQVPEGRYFVLGDHRSTSLDSRSDVIGTVAVEQIIGKVAFRIWPLKEFGFIEKL